MGGATIPERRVVVSGERLVNLSGLGKERVHVLERRSYEVRGNWW